MSCLISKKIKGSLVGSWKVPKSRETREESDHCGPSQLGEAPWKVLAAGGWEGVCVRLVFEPQPLPDLSASSSCSRRNNVSLGDERHPFVQALIGMLLCQVNEWQAGTAAGHSQCQAAKPAALGQPGPAGLGVLPASAPHGGGWGPSLQGDRGTGVCGERGVIGGRGRGRAGHLGGSQPLSEAYSSHPPFPSPPTSCFSDCQHQ